MLINQPFNSIFLSRQISISISRSPPNKTINAATKASISMESDG
jgi:hypothetical protein